MQPDLLGLEITKGELKRLCGVGGDAVFKPPTLSKFSWEISKTVLLILALAISCFLLSLAFPTHLLLLILIHSFVAISLVIDDAKKIFLSSKHKHLVSLFEDVERYNAVIKSIDINDQIEAAGNPGVKLRDRERVIQALQFTREDIVRALKTEKILRENERFIKLKPELFANNLNTLAALQVDEKASEYGRLLNEALQISLSIQDEMRQLQNRRLTE